MSDKPVEIYPGITAHPDYMGGLPCIKGTRIPASLPHSFAKVDYSVDDIMREYPDLSERQIADAMVWMAIPKDRRVAYARKSGSAQ